MYTCDLDWNEEPFAADYKGGCRLVAPMFWPPGTVAATRPRGYCCFIRASVTKAYIDAYWTFQREFCLASALFKAGQKAYFPSGAWVPAYCT